MTDRLSEARIAEMCRCHHPRESHAPDRCWGLIGVGGVAARDEQCACRAFDCSPAIPAMLRDSERGSATGEAVPSVPNGGDSGASIPEPHPGYGPCDGFGPGGQCSECSGEVELNVDALAGRVSDNLQHLVDELIRLQGLRADSITIRGERDEARQQLKVIQAERETWDRAFEQALQKLEASRERAETLERLSNQNATAAVLVAEQFRALQGACEQLKTKFYAYRDAPMTRGNKVEIATIRRTLNVVVVEFERLLTTPPVPSETAEETR